MDWEEFLLSRRFHIQERNGHWRSVRGHSRFAPAWPPSCGPGGVRRDVIGSFFFSRILGAVTVVYGDGRREKFGECCFSAAAFLSGPGEARRNSFAGLVPFSRRFSGLRLPLRAIGDGKTNDAWLSQTVDEPRPDRTGRLGSGLCRQDGKKRPAKSVDPRLRGDDMVI